MKTFLMNVRRREWKRGTNRAWLFLVFLSVVGQMLAQPTVTITGPTNSNSPQQLSPTSTNGPSGHQLQAPVKERAVSRFQGEARGEISYWLEPLVKTEAGAKPAPSYSPGLELRAPTPNSVQSEEYPGIEYSGILVQAVRSNPLQLINPFAPARYGDGEANILRNPVTREVEGLKLWQLAF
jgi:hypothetical protein